MSQLIYALTSVRISPRQYDQLHTEQHLNSADGLATLGLIPGSIDKLLVVISPDADTLFVHPVEDRLKFHCIGNSATLPSAYQNNLAACLLNYSDGPKFSYDLCAIVHHTQEQFFLNAAEQAGFTPVKASDEFFPRLGLAHSSHKYPSNVFCKGDKPDMNKAYAFLRFDFPRYNSARFSDNGKRKKPDAQKKQEIVINEAHF